MSEIKKILFLIFEFLRNNIYRKLVFLSFLSKNKLKVNGFSIVGNDIKSFVSEFDHIFYREEYFFESNKTDPLIIDCGANIGMSIVYFKYRYPNSQIIAFEPDKDLIPIINKNILDNKLTNIELRQEAISTKNGETDFYHMGDDSGSLHILEKSFKSEKVKIIRLKDILRHKETVEFLKLDIEGEETQVLEDCAKELDKVNHIFVDYHPTINKKHQSLSKIISILEDLNFDFRITPAYELKGSSAKFYRKTFNNYSVFAFKK